MPALVAATMVVVIIETQLGVAHAAEIAAVPGIDVLFLGGSDLMTDSGHPGQKDSSLLWQVAATARASWIRGA